MTYDAGSAAATSRPRDFCVQQLFETQAARTPHAIAIVQDDLRLSYGELDRRANQLAHHLRAAGVAAESRVGVLLGRSPHLPVALLAILKAGAAYVPLDPSAPLERRARVCRDAGLRLVVTGAALRDLLPPGEVELLELDAEAERIARQPGTAPEPVTSADNLAWLIYTSGSTGTPKGVMIPHRGAVNHALAVVERYGLGPADRVLQFAALGFDVAAEEIFPTLCAGATLALGPAGLPASFADFCAWVEARKVSVLNLPASWWHEWVAELDRGSATVPSCVRLVVVGSEAVLRSARERWVAHVGPRVRWLNAYGPTEATVTATVFEPPAGPLPSGATHTVPIGQPLPNVRAYVLDGQLRPVPDDEPGLLYLGGPGLARGYLGRPDLTAERFVPDPFGEPGARLYDTGDRARRWPDGTLEFCGRGDRQVKVRGHRIEPGEIEQALGAHPAVRQAVVVAREAAPGDTHLVAYVVPRGDAPAAEALRGFLGQRLPPYMLPAAFVALEALPVTPNGKLDPAALPAPDSGGGDRRGGDEPPRTDAEQILAGIFEEVLGLSRVGVREPFLELGGHSLAAMRVTGRVRERLRVELPVRALFETGTIEALARAIEALPRVADASPAIEKLPRPERIPLSFPQEQVWLVQQLDPASVAYTAPTLIRLEGALDVGALQRSIDELVRRHEILRTTFPAVDGQPVQEIHPPSPTPLPLTDLSHLPAEERQAGADRAIAAELQGPFALDRLPLLRWRLLRLSVDQHLLVVVEHHLVHDGWSTNVLFQELFELYAAFARGLPSPLPEPTLQFADFVLWHRRWLEGGEASRQLQHWTRKLAGAPARITLPTDHPRPPLQRFRGAALRMQLPAALDQALRERCRQEGVTPYVALLAAYVALLHRYSRQTDLCIGSGIANRRWRETEGMLGMIINTIVLRADLADDPPFRALLHRLRDLTMEAAAHQDVPFERIVEALQPERDPSHNPLFQVMFGLHDAPLAPVELPGLRWSLVESPSNGSAKFELGLIVIPRPEDARGWAPGLGSGGLTLIWEFNTDLFAPETIQRMQAQYRTLLEAALAAPEQCASRLPLLTAGEREQVVTAWNRTASAYPRERCVHELFSEQAARRPEAPAVRYGEQRLTYAELDERSSQLANHLRGAGVRAGTMVGLCLERSVELVVGILGILKAGGAYLPIDPSYPTARLALMLLDARARVVIAAGGTAGLAFPEAVRVIALDRDQAAIAQESTAAPAHGATAGDPAYVMYTSGSTGTPKGIAITHRGIARLVLGANYLQVQPDERVLQLSTPTFDATTIELYGALLNGAELVGLPKELALSPGDFHRALREHGITTLFLTTALFNQLVAERPDMFATVRNLMFGGEAVDPRRVREALRHGPPERLLHVYGPTECTSLSSWYRVGQVPEDAATVPIGHPLSNTTLYVLDEQLDPVPVGVPGELYIGGDGLGLGYVGQPDFTAGRFVPDPFGGQPGARLYATGDVVRRRPDGALEFIGRVDEQVKIRGFRIEPGEVEAVLSRHPRVKACLAMAREDAPGERYLAAYAVAHPGEEPPAPRELRGWLQERLPPYLVPSAIQVLDAFPLTPNGKVDRRALPAPLPDLADGAREHAPPRTPTEEALARIWAELLPAQEIGIHDNFFQLGGHSLRAMQVLARVRARLGVELPVRGFFESPTIADMATAVAQRSAAQAEQDRLAALLSELEHLSDEEARRLVGAHRPS